MNPLVQRILEVRREVDDARAAGLPDMERVVFLTGLEVAATWLLPPDDLTTLSDDLRQRDRKVQPS
jgi:hypothetical protein